MSTERPDPAASTQADNSPEETSFADLLSRFDQQRGGEARSNHTVIGTVVSVGPENVLIDIGRKTEGSLSLVAWREAHNHEPAIGNRVEVNVGPRNDEGYYQLSTIKVERPTDWTGLQAAFTAKSTISGTVVEQVKGGFRVDIGVRAFLPASRSGVREADELQQLVGQEIRCRITKLDIEKEDVVVDRRVILEEEDAQKRERAFSELREGAVLRGKVRSVMDFGAFVDLGGVDGLLHVAELSHSRIGKAGDAVKVGDELEVKIIKIDPATRKVSLSLKQLQEDPWSIAARTFKVGDRVSGTVARLTDFGAFIELLPGADGLVHVSELSWNKRVRKPGDLLKLGDRIDAVILAINPEERRISLGYKQALGDPWEGVAERFPVGSTVEGTISNLAAFGAFVEVGEGLEGMIHISDITNERRIDHPKDKLAKGQRVKAVVLELDNERRRLRLGLKQLEPTTVDNYIAEHQPGDTVSGRLLEVQSGRARVELGDGVFATCPLRSEEESQKENASAANRTGSADIGSLGAMLAAKWKTGGSGTSPKGTARAGEVRSFKIAKLDPARKVIELELAS